METKIIINPQNPNGLVVECSAEEIAEREADAQKILEEKQAKEEAEQAKADLKASAKAKLVAGEALTQEEADTIVL